MPTLITLTRAAVSLTKGILQPGVQKLACPPQCGARGLDLWLGGWKSVCRNTRGLCFANRCVGEAMLQRG